MKTILMLAAMAAVVLAAACPAAAQEGEPDEVILDCDWHEFDGVHLFFPGHHLRVGGRFAIDGIRYDSSNSRSSGLEFDDARLYIEGGIGIVDWWIEPDLIGADTPRNLYEAWASVTLSEGMRITAGQMRLALGSEFATREEHLPLVGYGFTSYLDGRYDTGVRLDTSLFEDSLYGEAAAATGHGFGLEGHLRTNPQYSVRLVGHPFQWFGRGAASELRGFFAGVALATSPDGDEPVILATPLESIVFRTPDLDGDSQRWLHLELGYRNGPFRAGWERVTGSTNNVPVTGGTKDMDQLTAWSLFAAYNLTGEEQGWERGHWAFASPEEGGSGWISIPGRLELAARYSNADIDRNLFDYGFTSYDPSTQEVRTFSLDLNWYPSDRTALSAGWVHTLADHELATFGDTSRDSSFVLRLGLTF
jgi:hypothetical protein